MSLLRIMESTFLAN